MKKIEVKTNTKSYKVVIGKGVFSEISSEVISTNSKVLFVSDRNVYNYHKSKMNSLIRSNKNFYFYQIHSTEKNKNLRSVEQIYKFLLKNNFSRNDIIVAVGGGIIGDVAGFVAATYMRGIRIYQVPTTLLSMVDSSVGGKTGVNIQQYKNLIGAFYPPVKVFADLNFLETLPSKEIISGAGEIFKYAFLVDEENYLLIRDKLSQIILNRSIDENLIAQCLKIKADVVETDEFETSGIRKVLNLGHTFAHAFESALKFQIKHGEAVIAGIFASLIVSEKLGIISKSDFQKYFSDFLFLPVNKKILSADSDTVIKFMKSDKKTADSKIKLVLVFKPGNILIDVLVDEQLVKKSLEELFEIFKTV